MKDPTLGDTPPHMRVGSEAIQVESEEDPFAEYLWMEHEEEFNQQVEEQLWEEEFIERCFQELLEEEQQWEEELTESCNQEEAEQWVWFVPPRDFQPQTLHQPRDQISLLVLDSDLDLVINSRLNPNAKEFIPGIQKHIM